MRFIAAALGLFLVGCSRIDDAAPVRPTAEAKSSAPPAVAGSSPAPCADPAGEFAVAVAWSSVSKSDGCFFFSGPGDLGRDTKLGDRARWRGGAPASLDFGAAKFEGPAGALVRRTRHDFNGPWSAAETISGAWKQPAPLAQTLDRAALPCPRFEGSYRYEECEERPGGECPGRCRIDAHLALSALSR